MLRGLFGAARPVAHDLGYCRLYDTQHGGRAATKLVLVEASPAIYARLKDACHPNLLPVLRVSQRAVYTRHVVPYATLAATTHEYRVYVVHRISSALEHLHTECRLSHGSVAAASILIDDVGNPLLGNFGTLAPVTADTAASDKAALDSLSRDLAGVPFTALPRAAAVFQTVEAWPTFAEAAQRRAAAEEFVAGREALIAPIRENIAALLTDEALRSTDAEHRRFIVDALVRFDEALLARAAPQLLKIMDTPVRLHLLRVLPAGVRVEESLSELCLGLRVRDRALRLETVRFLFRHAPVLPLPACERLLRAMQDVEAEDTIAEACTQLCTMHRADTHMLSDTLYKLLLRYLRTGRARAAVYRCLERYYRHFDMTRLRGELLLLLCARLCDSDAQDACFSLVESIIAHLKTNRAAMRRRDWSLRSLSDIFGSREGSTDSAAEVRARISQIERSHGDASSWEEQDCSP